MSRIRGGRYYGTWGGKNLVFLGENPLTTHATSYTSTAPVLAFFDLAAFNNKSHCTKYARKE